MKIQDLKDMHSILKHYVKLTEVKFKNEAIRRIAISLLEKVERKLNSL